MAQQCAAATRPDDHREDDDHPAQVRNLFAQWRDGRSAGLHKVSDFSELSIRASSEHNCGGLSGNHGGAGEQDVFPPGDVFARSRAGFPHQRQRFPGDRGVVDVDSEGFNEPAVGRNMVTLFQQKDIPWHQLLRGQLNYRTLAHHFGARGKQFAQRVERLLHAMFLPKGKSPADQDDRDDGIPEFCHPLPGLVPLGQKGESCGNPEDD